MSYLKSFAMVFCGVWGFGDFLISDFDDQGSFFTFEASLFKLKLIICKKDQSNF